MDLRVRGCGAGYAPNEEAVHESGGSDCLEEGAGLGDVALQQGVSRVHPATRPQRPRNPPPGGRNRANLDPS